MTLPGPYYQEDGITLYCGDCRDILPHFPDKSFDLVLTDPPYEIVTTGGGIGAQRKYLKDIEGFTDCGFDDTVLDKFENWICFCGKNQLIKLLTKAQQRRWMLITWNKPNPTPLSNNNYLPDTEYIIHSFLTGRLFGEYKDKSRYIVYPAQQGLFHPNEKPLEIIGKLIKLGSEKGNTILDPFCGSGTTLVAAKQLGRKAVGIEISEKYCQLTIDRLRQKELF